MNKLLLTLILLSMIPLVLAVKTIGPFQQDKNAELFQVCDNCSYVNLTTVQLPNSTILNIDINMTENKLTYNYTFIDTDLIGGYIYTTCGDPDGVTTCQSVNFQITTTGDSVDLSNVIIVIVFLVLTVSFLYLSSIFEADKWMIKTSFILFAILMSVLAVNSARIIASESTDLTTMGVTGFILTISVLSFMFLYILIHATVQAFKQLKHKEEVKWDV